MGRERGLEVTLEQVQVLEQLLQVCTAPHLEDSLHKHSTSHKRSKSHCLQGATSHVWHEAFLIDQIVWKQQSRYCQMKSPQMHAYTLSSCTISMLMKLGHKHTYLLVKEVEVQRHR